MSFNKVYVFIGLFATAMAVWALFFMKKECRSYTINVGKSFTPETEAWACYIDDEGRACNLVCVDLREVVARAQKDNSI